jgi:hypothetical protein
MNKKLLMVALLSATALLVNNISAKEEYGMAGCGLGSLVIKNDGFVQVFASTTNATSGSQIYGISSGTSNCVVSAGVAKNEKAQEIFVSTNYESLEQEAAMGKGEKLSALANLFGCESPKDFSAMAKSNYSKIFGAKESTPSYVVSSFKQEINKDNALRSNCKL